MQALKRDMSAFASWATQGANTVWIVAGTFSFSQLEVLHIAPQSLHCGHCNVPHDYSLPVARLGEFGHVWNHRHDRCGWLVAIYIMLNTKKVDCYIGWPIFPSA